MQLHVLLEDLPSIQLGSQWGVKRLLRIEIYIYIYIHIYIFWTWTLPIWPVLVEVFSLFNTTYCTLHQKTCHLHTSIPSFSVLSLFIFCASSCLFNAQRCIPQAVCIYLSVNLTVVLDHWALPFVWLRLSWFWVLCRFEINNCGRGDMSIRRKNKLSSGGVCKTNSIHWLIIIFIC